MYIAVEVPLLTQSRNFKKEQPVYQFKNTFLISLLKKQLRIVFTNYFPDRPNLSAPPLTRLQMKIHINYKVLDKISAIKKMYFSPSRKSPFASIKRNQRFCHKCIKHFSKSSLVYTFRTSYDLFFISSIVSNRLLSS